MRTLRPPWFHTHAAHLYTDAARIGEDQKMNNSGGSTEIRTRVSSVRG